VHSSNLVHTPRSPPVLQVNVSALPPGINEQLAHAIEFIGKAVRLLRAPPADALMASNAAAAAAAKMAQVRLEAHQQQLQQQAVAAAATAAAAGAGDRCSSPGSFRRSSSSIRGRRSSEAPLGLSMQRPPAAASAGWAAAAALHTKGQAWQEDLEQQLPVWWECSAAQGPLLPPEDTLEFCRALSALQQAPCANQVALERAVEAIRADVSRGVWQEEMTGDGAGRLLERTACQAPRAATAREQCTSHQVRGGRGEIALHSCGQCILITRGGHSCVSCF
jgi:hypothetical protein